MFSSCDANGPSGERETSESRLNKASVWVVEEGLSLYHSSGEEKVFRALLDRWGVQLDAEVQVANERYIALFNIKAGGVYYNIQCLYRENESDEVYEYWIVKISSRDWVGGSPECRFFVTKAAGVEGGRTIVTSSEQFVGSNLIVDGKLLELPIDDLVFLYDLSAWDYPENYVGSNLKEYAVVINDAREYEKVSVDTSQ